VFVWGLLRVRLTLWLGLVAVGFCVAVFTWGPFAGPGAPGPDWPAWAQATFEPILVGAVGTAALLAVALIFHLLNSRKS
ncbi:MAG: hypothetical protein RBR19_14970, partial [Sedimentisphaerales bacterium]|jgi:hypothetical protein|nr:hypothetical protein [Sedimentisphaerales bacterium]